MIISGKKYIDIVENDFKMIFKASLELYKEEKSLSNSDRDLTVATSKVGWLS